MLVTGPCTGAAGWVSLSAMFTVVIPHFNHSKSLERALAARTEASEWIVVDDGSDARECEEAQRIAADHGARFVPLARNEGPAVARNQGAALAQQPFVVFLDADDALLPEFGEHVARYLTANPDVEAIHPAMRYEDLPADVDLDPLRRRHSDMVTPSGLTVRREVFLRSGGFPEDPVFRGPAGGEDVAFINALGAVAEVHYWSRTLVVAHAGAHLIRYLRRTRVVDGEIVFTARTPEEESGALGRAMAACRDRVKRRMGAG